MSSKTYFVALCLLLVFSTSAYAHKVTTASAVLHLDTEKKRTFRLSLALQVESSQDQELDDKISPEDAARTFVEEYIQVLIDDKQQAKSLELKVVNLSDEETPEELRQMAVLVEWKGKLPKDGKELHLYLDDSSELSIVLATVRNGTPTRRMQVVFAGEYSRPQSLE